MCVVGLFLWANQQPAVDHGSLYRLVAPPRSGSSSPQHGRHRSQRGEEGHSTRCRTNVPRELLLPPQAHNLLHRQQPIQIDSDQRNVRRNRGNVGGRLECVYICVSLRILWRLHSRPLLLNRPPTPPREMSGPGPAAVSTADLDRACARNYFTAICPAGSNTTVPDGHLSNGHLSSTGSRVAPSAPVVGGMFEGLNGRRNTVLAVNRDGSVGGFFHPTGPWSLRNRPLLCRLRQAHPIISGTLSETGARDVRGEGSH